MRRKTVETLEELAVEDAPPSDLENALTTLVGGESIVLDPSDGVMLVHWKLDGEVLIHFPQLGILSPGRIEQTTMKMYRALMIARAGIDPAKMDEEDDGAPIVEALPEPLNDGDEDAG